MRELKHGNDLNFYLVTSTFTKKRFKVMKNNNILDPPWTKYLAKNENANKIRQDIYEHRKVSFSWRAKNKSSFVELMITQHKNVNKPRLQLKN